MRYKILILDNMDSFTWNLVDYFKQLHVHVVVKRNNEPLSAITAEKYDGVVLSPGPGVPDKAGALMQVIQYYYQRVPMLGICLGHQALGTFFGAKLKRAFQPMHGKMSQIACGTSTMFGQKKMLTVVRYHSLILDSLPSSLQPTAVSLQENELMAFFHQHYPLWGVQFHPEAILTEEGIMLLKNWLSNCVSSSIQHKYVQEKVL